METQYISLNMTPTGVNPCFHISQYDVGRMLGFIVHSGGATVDLDTYTCTIEATRSDGTAITSAVATTDNIGTFEVTPTMSNKTDKYRCQLVIVDANSKRIASLPFDMEVTKAAMDENSEAIEEDASLYQQYTEAVQGAIAEANADIQAEENARIAAVNAEATARQNADATLQNNIDAEATARQSADNTLQGNINSEAATRASADSNLQSQINQIVAPSGEAPSAAEVQNARIGADGVTYPTLGDAVRQQVGALKKDIVNLSVIDIGNISEWEDGYVGWNNGKQIALEGGLYKVSPFIDVSEFSAISFPICFDGYSGIAFYNQFKNYLTGIGKGDYKIGDVVKYYIRDDASYMRITYKTNTNVNPIFLNCTQSKRNAFAGFGKQITIENYEDNLTDLNSANANTVYSVAFNAYENHILNAPQYPFQGNVITMSYKESNNETALQIVNTPDNNIYFRTFWSNWRPWIKLNNLNSRTAVRPIGTNVDIDDLNDAEFNSIFNIAKAKNEEELKNAPRYPFQGIIATISGFGSVNNIAFQFCITPYSQKSYYRYLWGNWRHWIEIGDNDNIKFKYSEYGLFNAFDTVGCIGDSLASGESVSNVDGKIQYIDMYQYSWGQFMARATGNKFYNFSSGGLTTRTWLTSNHKTTALDGNHDCKCYIIGLGQNDQLSDYRNVPVGNESDIGTDADTYYGNYSRIINLLKSRVPKAKFFLLTNPIETGTISQYNIAVRNIAKTLDNCYCIDMVDYKNEFINPDTIISNAQRHGHYNAIGYSYIAKLMMEAINKYMYEHQSEFSQIEFIGTDYLWT